MMAKFKHIALHDWRQFGSVGIDFHERMTIITGANGAGKTTILNILSQHFGWGIALVNTLKITRSGARRYFFSSTLDEEGLIGPHATVGALTYDNGHEAGITVPLEGESFQVAIDGRQHIDGLYITSHRPVYTYQRVTEIPTEIQATSHLFDQYLSNIRQYHQPRSRVDSPSHRLKASLISLANFGYGNEVVEPNLQAQQTFEGFSRVLEIVLPSDLGFRRLAIRMPEVVLECDSGDFSLDAASGGVSALIDIAWQIHMQSLISHEFTLVIDEPENHLHPKLQRTMLPGLLEAFPQVQFIVATHNPFVVTSVRDSSVMVLDFFDGRVVSTALDNVDRSASANQVLADVLGIPFPAPLWVEKEVDKIVESIAEQPLTEELLLSIRHRLDDIGLGNLFPVAIDRLLPIQDIDHSESGE